MQQQARVRAGGVSPLVEIEGNVQARAKDRAFDVAGEGGPEVLRHLVVDEVARWQADYRRGLRAVDLADPDQVADRAYRNLAGYGPLAPLLDDPDVWEIMVNGPDAIFVKRHSGPSGYHDEVFHDDEHVVRTLTKILDDASGSHRKLDPAEGLQDAQLDNGARLHIVHGDVGRDGHLLVNIRKFTGVAYRSLEDLVDRDMLDAAAAEFLRAAVRSRQSIVFAGAPGSGKTTMLSCCAAELDPSLRVVIAEEVFEADVPVANVASMQTRPSRADRREVDLRRARRGLPAHGARRGHRGRGPRPRGPAAPAHAVLRGQGLHDHPRRVRPPGPDPAALRVPVGRHRIGAADVGSQQPGERSDRPGRALRPGARHPPGHRDRGRGGVADRGPGHRLHRHRALLPAALRRPAHLDGQPPRAGRPRLCRSGLRRPGPPRRRRDGGPAVTQVVLAVAAAYGAHLLFTA
ncbi:MAG: CpaF family protein, partial [Acidimicrobiia bacterium]|nr:CpaF family protein [Acidimicrobiia bacterium]